MKEISIVVPVYKSATTLAELHRRLGAVAAEQHWNCEIVYVHDASPDESIQILLSLPPWPSFRVVDLNKNLGQSSALLMGMAFCEGEIVACMDADLQDEPEFLPEMMGAFDTSLDIVFAKRTGQYESAGRLLTSVIFKSLVSVFSRGSIPYQAGLFFVIRKRAIPSLLAYLPGSPYLLGAMAIMPLKSTSVTVKRDGNKFGETSYTFKKRLKVACNFFRTLRMTPLRDEKVISEWISAQTRRIVASTD